MGWEKREVRVRHAKKQTSVTKPIHNIHRKIVMIFWGELRSDERRESTETGWFFRKQDIVTQQPRFSRYVAEKSHLLHNIEWRIWETYMRPLLENIWYTVCLAHCTVTAVQLCCTASKRAGKLTANWSLWTTSNKRTASGCSFKGSVMVLFKQ